MMYFPFNIIPNIRNTGGRVKVNEFRILESGNGGVNKNS